jgi:hypothetical protein
VKDLRRRHAGRLAEQLAAINQERQLVRLPPGENRVRTWIAQAQKMEPMLTYRG